jgi:hypothetical protein
MRSNRLTASPLPAGPARCGHLTLVDGPGHPAGGDGHGIGADALLRDGATSLYVDGDLGSSRASFDAAFRRAELDGDGDAMALAALGLSGLFVHEHRGVVDAALVDARLRRALAGVDPGSVLAVRLRARIAAEADHRAGRNTAILAVMAEARATGDPVVTAEAANLAHHCLGHPDHGALRHGLAHELIAEGARTSRPSDLLLGVLWRTVDLILDADPAAEPCLVQLSDLLARRDNRAVGFVADAIGVMLGIRAGQLPHAEARARRCAERGRLAGHPDAAGWHGAHLFAIRWYQGRVAELLPMLQELVRSPALGAAGDVHLAALAVAAAAAGDRRRAAGAVARLRQDDRARPSRSSAWLVSMYGVVEAAYRLDDEEACADAYERLRPFAGRLVVAGPGIACLGSVRHTLGMAALGAGATDRAIEHFREAVRADLAIGHWPAAALARARLAQALARRGGHGDRADADRELQAAWHEATELGMTLPVPGPDGAATAATAAGHGRRPRLTCRRQGNAWSVGLDDRHAVVPDAVGVTYLSVLLANPGRDIPAIELAVGPGLRSVPAAGRAAGSTQPVLDQTAVRAYRARLTTLEAEIEGFGASTDPVRVERATAEYDWLLAELGAAVGLGGEVRRFADDEERARVSVGKAIRRAIGRIAANDPAIGEELRATIRTGRRCSYEPRDTVNAGWRADSTPRPSRGRPAPGGRHAAPSPSR